MTTEPRLAVMFATVSCVIFLWATSVSAILALVVGLVLLVLLAFYVGGKDMWKQCVATLKAIDTWIDTACDYLLDN